MSAVVIEGGLVHYERIGRGHPILFLHGWLGSWRYWMSTMQALSDQYRSYALDLWGFGDSDKSQARFEVADYVELLDNFVSTLGISQAPLVGHALGAAVAVEYAARFPDRVTKLILVSLPLNPQTISRKLLYAADDSVMAKVMWWRRQQISHPEVQTEAEKTSAGAINASLISVARLDMSRQLQDLGRAAGKMVLAVYGEKDDVIDPGPARLLDEAWPNLRAIGLAESRHFPMLDEAARFTRLLKDFLDVEEDLSALALKEEWRRRTR